MKKGLSSGVTENSIPLQFAWLKGGEIFSWFGLGWAQQGAKSMSDRISLTFNAKSHYGISHILTNINGINSSKKLLWVLKIILLLLTTFYILHVYGRKGNSWIVFTHFRQQTIVYPRLYVNLILLRYPIYQLVYTV